MAITKGDVEPVLTQNGQPVPIGGPWMPELETKLQLAPPSVDRVMLRAWEERLCEHIRVVGDHGLLCAPTPTDQPDYLTVYADWLEEEGWPEFAAVVRASLKMEFGGGAYCCGWLHAALREKAYLDALLGDAGGNH